MFHTKNLRFLAATALLTLPVALVAAPRPARACGCLSPPVVMEGDYAVNQQAEQIIFEVGESTVTAHVLIRYQGDPAQFAWILPVPNQPELALSEAMAFPVLDNVTGPRTVVNTYSACPGSAYGCNVHEDPCYWGDTDWGESAGATSGGGTGGGGGEPPPGVDVLDMQIVGDYETVTFAAQDAALAVQWLQDNGFVVNDTMTPYMQPYIDAGMVFVAAKLVAGAGLDSIKPLKMTYQGTTPMIPLQLTAVATEPHLTVTAFIYANGSYYRPIGHPIVEPDASRLSADSKGRNNYPMLLARTVDEAGGDGFVVEYAGSPPQPGPAPEDDPSGCCSDGSDWCGIGFDGQCQCPGAAFDMEDCADIPGLWEGAQLVADLEANYTHLTRLTTRLSAEEMTFDPSFEPAPGLAAQGRLSLYGERYEVAGCEADVIDQTTAAYVAAIEDCAAVYCGKGQCVQTDAGVGCACDAGFVARVFTDLDGEPSVTCVPETPPVILDKDVALPDPCEGVSCGAGQCVDLGGFAACACDGAAAATVGQGDLLPVCAPIVEMSNSPGAENFTSARKDLPICFAAPPDCGPNGWLEPYPADWLADNGVLCESSMPDPADLVEPPNPYPDTCEDTTGGWGDDGGFTTGADGGGGASGGGEKSDDGGGCACRSDRGPGWAGGLFGLGLLGLLRLGRRRRLRG